MRVIETLGLDRAGYLCIYRKYSWRDIILHDHMMDWWWWIKFKCHVIVFTRICYYNANDILHSRYNIPIPRIDKVPDSSTYTWIKGNSTNMSSNMAFIPGESKNKMLQALEDYLMRRFFFFVWRALQAENCIPNFEEFSKQFLYFWLCYSALESIGTISNANSGNNFLVLKITKLLGQDLSL